MDMNAEKMVSSQLCETNFTVNKTVSFPMWNPQYKKFPLLNSTINQSLGIRKNGSLFASFANSYVVFFFLSHLHIRAFCGVAEKNIKNDPEFTPSFALTSSPRQLMQNILGAVNSSPEAVVPTPSQPYIGYWATLLIQSSQLLQEQERQILLISTRFIVRHTTIGRIMDLNGCL